MIPEAGVRPHPERRDHQLQRRGPDRGDPRADRWRRRRPRHRRRRRGRRAPEVGAAAVDNDQAQAYDAEVRAVAPDAAPSTTGSGGELWKPGDGPSQAARWAVQAVAKAGTIGVIGVYPPGFDSYPFGEAFNKNLTIKMGNANHRRYLPELLDLVLTGVVDPLAFISERQETVSAIEAYQTFDQRQDGWLKTVLDVA